MFALMPTQHRSALVELARWGPALTDLPTVIAAPRPVARRTSAQIRVTAEPAATYATRPMAPRPARITRVASHATPVMETAMVVSPTVARRISTLTRAIAERAGTRATQGLAAVENAPPAASILIAPARPSRRWPLVPQRLLRTPVTSTARLATWLVAIVRRLRHRKPCTSMGNRRTATRATGGYLPRRPVEDIASTISIRPIPVGRLRLGKRQPRNARGLPTSPTWIARPVLGTSPSEGNYLGAKIPNNRLNVGFIQFSR